MKKVNPIICFAFLAALAACNSDSASKDTAASTNSSGTASTSIDSNGANASPGAQSSGNMNTTNTTRTPLGAQDSMFVMKAAMGGMMEVNAGNVAQQNGMSDRVKAFGSMMVNDHSKANQELMTLASSRGMTLPTALPADMQKHVDQMKNMKGKAFDQHYMGMMLTDHKKDIADFEKQANKGTDADLKAWATKTLPTLRMHLDSAQSISKAKM